MRCLLNVFYKWILGRDDEPPLPPSDIFIIFHTGVWNLISKCLNSKEHLAPFPTSRLNPIRCNVWETEISVCGVGGHSARPPPPRKTIKELSETPCCFIEVGPMLQWSSHEKNRFDNSKTGRDFKIWKFDEIEILHWLDSPKHL